MTEDCPHITVQRKGAIVMTEDCPHITMTHDNIVV